MDGACGCSIDKLDVKVWDVQVGERYFIGNRDESRMIDFQHPIEECCVCLEPDCGIKMSCGHFVCPDDLLRHAWIQIQILKHEINCPKCTSIISIGDIIKFGLPEEDEKQFLTTAISVNFCESQDIKQCPNCFSYCQRINPNAPQVNCIVCTKRESKNFIFCWYCLGIWRGLSGLICENFGCRKDEIEQLKNSPLKQFRDITGNVVSSPQTRACPGCFTMLQHKEACNEMTCTKCNLKFCFLCLSKASDGSLYCKGRTWTKITCTPAPVQTKLRAK